MFKKSAADSIADEMFRLLNKKASMDELVSHPPKMHNAADDEEDAADDEEDDASDMKHMSDEADDEEDEADDEEDSADDEEDSADDEEDNLEDFLMSDEEDDDEDDSYVDDEIRTMQNHAEDELMRNSEGSHESSMSEDDLIASASDMKLMRGLGKIEASLRGKGEGFAADLVRTTAMSIKEDIVKQASNKSFVIRSLKKKRTTNNHERRA